MARYQSALAAAVAVVAAVVLLFGRVSSAGPLSSNNTITSAKMRNVCLLYVTAMSECDPAKPPSTYTGYETELFRKMAVWMAEQGQTEWAESNYTFTCKTDFNALQADVLKTDGTRECDVIFAGMHISSMVQMGPFKFSANTYSAGQAIMIYVPPNTDIFAFLKPFSAEVWLTIFATSVFVAIVVTLMEVPMRRLVRNPAGATRKFMNLQWAAVGMLLQAMQQFNARTTGARLTILGYAFVILIIINSYIAVLSSQLTVTSISLSINSISDLLTKRVGVFELDVVRWKTLYNLQLLTPLPWNSKADEENMVALLRSRKIDAILLDKPWVDYNVATNCDLYTVGDQLLPFTVGYVFPPDTSLEYLTLWNKGQYIMQETGVMSSLESTHIKPASSCSGKGGGDLANAQITLKQIAGLWIFLAGALGLGLLCNLASWAWERFRRNRVDDDSAPDMGASFNGSMKDGAGPQVSASGASTISLKGRNASMFKNAPELSWATVADASTVEEGLELMEGLIKQLDRRMKTHQTSVDSKLSHICDTLGRMNGQTSGKGSALFGADVLEAAEDAPGRVQTVSFSARKSVPVPPVDDDLATPSTPITAFTPQAVAEAELIPEPPHGPPPAYARGNAPSGIN